MEESAHLLDSPSRRRRRGAGGADKGNIQMTTRGVSEDSSPSAGYMDSEAALAAELKSPIRKEEGLYPGHDSSIVPLLLTSEPVDLPLAKLVGPNIYLSRCAHTQIAL
jgi:hypothetical protein